MDNFKSFLHYFFLSPHQYSIKYFILLLVLILFIQTSIIGFHTVMSESMEDTLLVGDTVLVFNTWYGFRPPLVKHTVTPGFRPKHGDIVIFPYPNDPSKEYVKRVVATGKDIFAIANKKLIVNLELENFPSTAKHADPNIIPKKGGKRDYYPVDTVPKDSLFVLGDNRDFSNDSRVWGFLGKRRLSGRVARVAWSVDPEVPWSDFRHKIRWERLGKKLE